MTLMVCFRCRLRWTELWAELTRRREDCPYCASTDIRPVTPSLPGEMTA